MNAAEEHLQALEAIFDAINEATANADWERLQALDGSSRAQLEALVAAAKAGELPVTEVTDRLDRLQALFEAARAAAVIARDQAEIALKSSGRTHQAAQAYLENVKK